MQHSRVEETGSIDLGGKNGISVLRDKVINGICQYQVIECDNKYVSKLDLQKSINRLMLTIITASLINAGVLIGGVAILAISKFKIDTVYSYYMSATGKEAKK